MTSEAFTATALFAVGLWVCVSVAKRTGDRTLVGIVTAAYLVRVVFAVIFYVVSFWALPVWRDVQLGQGFWAFASDAAYLHEYATGAVTALVAGLDLPFVAGSPDYPLMVTLLYRFLGTHVLIAVTPNIMLAGLSVVLAYLIACRIWSPMAGHVSAALVAFWPSSVLWSTQLLKDTLAGFLILLFVWTLTELLRRWPKGVPTYLGWLNTGTLFAVAFVTTFAAVRFRYYVGVTLLGASLVVLVAWVVFGLSDRRAARAVWAVTLTAVLVCAVWLSTLVPVEVIGKPRDPQPGLRRLAEHMISIGDLDGALVQVQASVRVRPDAPADADVRDRMAGRELSQLIAQYRSGVAGATPSPAALPPLARSLEPPSDGSGFLQRLSQLRSRFEADFHYARTVLGDSEDVPRDVGEVVRFAPRALFFTLLTPNPWISARGVGSTGVFRDVAFLEVMLILPLLCLAAQGFVNGCRHAWPMSVLLALFAFVMTVGIGYAVPNVGTLFRLRLAAIVPLCILAGGSQLPAYVSGMRKVVGRSLDRFVLRRRK